MSRVNPTSLRVGMSGRIQGRHYTVRGRVVLSMVADDGETYYWNEFDMVDSTGSTATLVFEETEEGPTWKWFILLAPRNPLTATEAAVKQVGDTVEFEGREIPITLVDESKVVFIEGEAPEGVEVGDVAHYFNADAGGDRMYVASWTDGEIEFYIGGDLKRRVVDAAFGITTPGKSAASGGVSWTPSLSVLATAAVIVGFIVISLSDELMPSHRAAPAPAMQPAPAQRWPADYRCRIEQEEYRVLAGSQTTMLLRRSRFQLHEYLMQGVDGRPALVLHGWRGDAGSRLFLRQEKVPAEFTPEIAASLKRGTLVEVGGEKFVITDLIFTRLASGASMSVGSPWQATEQYGFMARLGPRWLFCRWSADSIQWYFGREIALNEVQPVDPTRS